MNIYKALRIIMILFLKSPWLAIKMLLQEILRRLYSDEKWVVFRFDLLHISEPFVPEIPLTIREFAPKDISALFNLRQNETSEKELREMLVRLSWLKASPSTLYVGTTFNNFPCCLCWLISANENSWLQKKRLQPLKYSEVLLDNIWTHPDYRGKRLMGVITRALFEKARQQGAQQAISYIRFQNKPSLAGSKKIGWEPYLLREVYHRAFLRFITFKHISSDTSWISEWFRIMSMPTP
jgi:hypothetical protein